ncbi:MAG: hypothetical protein WBQ07_16600 [Candidatus Acidiferrales bacterium]
MIENDRLRGNWGARHVAKAARSDFNELRIRHFEQPALIFYRGNVSAFGDILGVLFFLYLEIGDAHIVIVLQSQLYRLLQRNVARSCRLLG